MSLSTNQVLRGVAIGVGGLAALAAALELSRAIVPEVGHQAAPVHEQRDALEHCRALTPEDYAADQTCRAAWDQSRRHFFGLPVDPAGAE